MSNVVLFPIPYDSRIGFIIEQDGDRWVLSLYGGTMENREVVAIVPEPVDLSHGWDFRLLNVVRLVGLNEALRHMNWARL